MSKGVDYYQKMCWVKNTGYIIKVALTYLVATTDAYEASVSNH
jgi:hypothetical protein